MVNKKKPGLVLALDGMAVNQAENLLDQCGLLEGGKPPNEYGLPILPKLGLEMIYRVLSAQAGAADFFVKTARPGRFFLDAKLWDIPNTVRLATQAAAHLSPRFLTVHGNPDCIAAAREGIGEKTIKLLAVLALTSQKTNASQFVEQAHKAKEAGADGVIASAHEVKAVRASLGEDFLILTPGIRPAGSAKGDQKRVATPAQAVREGADYLVVGRPISQAPDPRAALADVLKEMAEAIE